MDVIEKIIAGHQDIRERENILKKLVKMSDKDAFFWDNALKVFGFFDREVLQHMEIEEQVLFPVLHQAFPQQYLPFLSQFTLEHEPLREKITAFGNMAQQHARHPSRGSRVQVVGMAREIIEMAIPHSQREDELLFPLIKKYFEQTHYRALEDRYVKHLHR